MPEPKKLALLLWPHPRQDREARTYANPAAHEEMDGLSHLANLGYRLRTLHPTAYPWNPLARKGSLWAGIDPLRALRLFFMLSKADVLIGVGDSSLFIYSQLRGLLASKTPTVLIDPAFGNHYGPRKRIQDWVLPSMDHVVVYGKAQLRYLEKTYGKKVKASFIPHRMDTQFFDPALCKTRPSQSDAGYVYSVGNDPLRDFMTLVKACEGLTGFKTRLQTKRKIPSENPDIQTDPSWISYEELRERYQAAALVVVPLFPSVHAGGINGLLEAMSMAKPVVVTQSEGIEDYVEHRKTALVVPPGDPQAMREAIGWIFDHPGEAKAMGERAREFCLQKCAMPLYAAQLDHLIKGLAQP